MKIAIIGSGISGVSAAYYLNKQGHEISLFEAGHYFGGHTNTIDIEVDSKSFPIDTGFLVHNNRTYPHLIEFFKELEIDTHESDMSLSVKSESDELEWSGHNLNTVFTQRRNLVNPRFYKFLKELLRFNTNASSYIKKSEGDLNYSLGNLLDDENYSRDFAYWYLLPMGGCIWSTPVDDMLDFPAFTFLVFCDNHGLLQVTNHPQWKTINNGCRTYVEKALSTISDKRLNTPVLEIVPATTDKKALVRTAKGEEEFDRVIVATHAPTTFKLLKDSGLKALDYIRNFKYSDNKVVVHTDRNVLPTKENAWAAWNYLAVKDEESKYKDVVCCNYLINLLQPLPVKTPVIVTLNPVSEINKDSIIRELDYEHPLFDSDAITSQNAVMENQGEGDIYFTGAWLRYGFHEDGIWSFMQIQEKFDWSVDEAL